MASLARVINFLLVPFIPKGREKFWSRENRGEVIRKPKNKNSLCLHLTLRLPGKGSRVCKIKRAKIRHPLRGQGRRRFALPSGATVSACPADSAPTISSKP